MIALHAFNRLKHFGRRPILRVRTARNDLEAALCRHHVCFKVTHPYFGQKVHLFSYSLTLARNLAMGIAPRTTVECRVSVAPKYCDFVQLNVMTVCIFWIKQLINQIRDDLKGTDQELQCFSDI